MQKNYEELLEQEAVRKTYISHGGSVYLSAKDIARVTDEYDYTGHDSYLLPGSVRKSINSALFSLSCSGLLSLMKVHDPHAEVYRAKVSTDMAKTLFSRHGYTDRDKAVDAIRDAFDTLEKNHDLMPETIQYLFFLRANPFSIDSIFRKTNMFGQHEIDIGINNILGADAVIRNGTEQKTILIRNLSSAVFGMSKVFGNNITGIYTTLKKILICSDEYRDYENLDMYSLFRIYGVCRNPFSEYMKADASVSTTGGTIDTHGLTFAFRSDEETEYKAIVISNKRLVTIENLTTYNDFNEPDTAKIYTGGYPSPFLCHLLEMIARDNPDIKIYHYGDIDVNGFKIFMHVFSSCDGRVLPYKMDIEDIKNAHALVDLTDWDKKELLKFSGTKFDAVSKYMLKISKKVEQESEDIYS